MMKSVQRYYGLRPRAAAFPVRTSKIKTQSLSFARVLALFSSPFLAFCKIIELLSICMVVLFIN